MKNKISTSGTFAGISKTEPHLVGVIIHGKFKRLKWLSCENDSIIKKVADFKIGAPVQIILETDIKKNKMILCEINLDSNNEL